MGEIPIEPSAVRGRTRNMVLKPNVLVGGFLAGVCGGIVMGVAAFLWMRAIGMGASAPFQLIAGTYYGPMALVGAAGVTAIGVLTFLGIAGIIGVIFSALTVNASSSVALFWIGIPYGIAVWAVMTYVIVPVFDATLDARIPLIVVMWFFLHWIYGAFTGLFIPWFRRGTGTIEVVEPARKVA